MARGVGFLFRERQIIVHDGAHVRRFTLRRWHQIGAFSVLAAVVAWGAVATSVYFDGQAMVAERNGEITRRVAELDSIKANYRAAFKRLDQFQTLFTSITCEIGDIQSSLLHVAERSVTPERRTLVPHQSAAADRGGCGPEIAARDKDGAPAASAGNTAPAGADAVPATAVTGQTEGGETARIVGSLSSASRTRCNCASLSFPPRSSGCARRTARFCAESADITAKKVGALEKALSKVGVDAARLGDEGSGAGNGSGMPEGVASQFGTGGPFVPLPKGESAGQSFDPVALFNSHADRLDSLITAMRTLPLATPLEDAEVTSPFGARDDPFNEQTAFHEGVDFGAPLNSPVFATGDGQVIWAGWRDKYGIMVEIDHGHGLSTRYAHLARTLVHVGDHVARGRPIGLLGNTGRSTGPHLHYEVRVNDQATDPLKFITAGRDVLKNE